MILFRQSIYKVLTNLCLTKFDVRVGHQSSKIVFHVLKYKVYTIW